MGIKGLQKFLASFLGTNIEYEHVEQGSLLLVDGNGFLYHILSERSKLLPREYGGSYHIFDLEIRKEISRLSKIFQIKFYFVGWISRMKDRTLEKRTIEKDESWSNILNYFEKGTRYDPFNLPLPPLYSSQLRQTLNDLKIEIIECDEEADQEIAKACNYHNNLEDETNTCYCYGNDRYYI